MNGREITAEKVSELFAKHCRRRRPLPRPYQCQGLATTINVICHDNRRNGKSYRHIFEQQNKRRSEDRPLIEWLEKRIEEKREEFELLNYPQGIDALEITMASLSPPTDPLVGQRNSAWWHKAALMIATGVKDIMESVDSRQKNILRERRTFGQSGLWSAQIDGDRLPAWNRCGGHFPTNPT